VPLERLEQKEAPKFRGDTVDCKAASAVFMAPVRIKAVRKALSSALGIVSIAIKEILSDACRSKSRDAAERSTLARLSVARVLD